MYLMVCVLHQIFMPLSSEEIWLGGTCSWHGADEKYNLFEEPKEKRAARRPTIVERIMLKLI
jgi:hypothetical protein